MLFEFVYAYAINTNLARTGISSLNNFHISKLLIFALFEIYRKKTEYLASENFLVGDSNTPN